MPSTRYLPGEVHEEGGEAVARTSAGGFSGEDLGKLLAIASALIAIGVLPKRWQKGVSAATALLLISRLL